MNTIEEDLFAWLSTDSAGLVPLVGTRIFPNRIPPETTPRPWLHYSVTSSEPAGELKQTQTIISEVEFSIYAERYEDVRAITTALVTRLDGFRGGVIKRVLWDNYYATDVEEGHLGTAIFRVWSGVSGTIAPRGGTARVVFGAGSVDVLPNGQDSVATFTTGAVTFHAPLYGDASNLTGIPTPDLSDYAKLDEANLFASPSAITVPITIRGASGQTADYFAVQDSAGNWRIRLTPTPVVSGASDGSLLFRPGTATYGIGVNDPSSALVFSRGTASIFLSPGATNNRIAPGAGAINFVTAGGAVLFTPNEGGGTGTVQFGRRFSDSSSGVGASVEFWTNTGQSAPAIVVKAPGGGTNRFTVSPSGYTTATGYALRSGAADPTTSDLADGYATVWRNTTSGEIRLWVNVSGVLLSTPALE